METNKLLSVKNEIIFNVSQKILFDCQRKSIDVLLFGGASLLFLPGYEIDFITENRGDINDIDLVVNPKDVARLKYYLVVNGFKPDINFNFQHGNKRICYYREEDNLSIDVFIGDILLCQKIETIHRFRYDKLILAPMILFLTKIQKLKLSDKDIFDINLILKHIDLCDFRFVIELCSKNWRWYKTIITNIFYLLKEKRITDKKYAIVLEDVADKILVSRKTICWNIRKFFGGQWYNDVEERKNPDWNETNTTSDNYIRNKPVINNDNKTD